MKEKDTKVPKYQYIESDIIEKINEGEYAVDTAIPSEAELVDIYKCSRVTIRQALSNLVFKGFIYKKRGMGAYVSKPKTIQRNPLIKSFSEDMKEKGKVATSKVNSFNITKAGKSIAKLIGVHENDTIYYIERIRFADNAPLMFERTFMSVELHPEISMKVFLSSKYQYAKEHGLDIEYADQTISPIFASEYIANALNITTKQPMLKIGNTTYLKDGRIFDYTELYLHPELYQLKMTKQM